MGVVHNVDFASAINNLLHGFLWVMDSNRARVEERLVQALPGLGATRVAVSSQCLSAGFLWTLRPSAVLWMPAGANKEEAEKFSRTYSLEIPRRSSPVPPVVHRQCGGRCSRHASIGSMQEGLSFGMPLTVWDHNAKA